MRLLLTASIGLLLVGCAHAAYHRAAQNQLKRDSLDGAVEYLSLALREKPDSAKSGRLLEDVLPRAARIHAERGAALAGQGRYAEALAAFDRHADLRRLASSTPGGTWTIEDEEPRRAAAAAAAAAAAYEEGSREMDGGRMREAARAFRRCLAFVPRYRDAEALYGECLASAVRTVAVRGLATDTAWAQEAAGLAARSIQLFRELRLEFMRFVDEQDLERMLEQQSLSQSGLVDAAKAIEAGRLVGIAIFVDFHLDQAAVEDSGWREEREARAKEIPVQGTRTVRVRNPDGTETVREETYVQGTKTVHAELVTRSRQTAASLTVHYEMTDVETGVTDQGTYTDRLEDTVRYTTYSGDKAALGIMDMLALQGARRDPSSPGAMLGKLLDAAAERLAREIAPAFR